MKNNDREKNIIHYGNAASILSVLSVVAAFVVVCIGLIYLLAKLDLISVPGFISGEKEAETSQNGTEGQNLLDALTGSGEILETPDTSLDSGRLKSVLANHNAISPYVVTGTITYSGDKYTRNLRFFACIYGKKYRVDIYEGANIVRSTVFDGSDFRVTDGYGTKYLDDTDYFDSDAALPIPSLKRLCTDGDYEFVSAYIEKESGNCVCRGRFTDKNMYDEIVISTEYGIITSADTYVGGKLIYSCRINLISTGISDPDSVISSPTI